MIPAPRGTFSWEWQTSRAFGCGEGRMFVSESQKPTLLPWDTQSPSLGSLVPGSVLLSLTHTHTHKSIHAHTLLIHTFLPCSNAYTGHGAHLSLGCGWRSVVVNRAGVLTWTPPAAGGGGNAAFRWPLCDPACRTHAPRRSRHSWLPRAGNTNQRILDLSVRENKMVRVMLYHELFTCSFIFVVIFEPTCRLNIDIHSI